MWLQHKSKLRMFIVNRTSFNREHKCFWFDSFRQPTSELLSGTTIRSGVRNRTSKSDHLTKLCGGKVLPFERATIYVPTKRPWIFTRATTGCFALKQAIIWSVLPKHTSLYWVFTGSEISCCICMNNKFPFGCIGLVKWWMGRTYGIDGASSALWTCFNLDMVVGIALSVNNRRGVWSLWVIIA